MKDILKTLIFCSLIFLSFSANADEWKKRAIYQLMTDRFASSRENLPPCKVEENKYCGGDHKGIEQHLDYITDMGFDAIWISPIVKNAEGSYHSYHTIDFYDINENFGTKQDILDLVKKCHDEDVFIMLDVVANHVGLVGNDFSSINPFNSPEHYHEPCTITDWTNYVMVENCRLADLPDLKHENDYVADELLRWIKYMVKEYSLDGLRVDTVPEVPKWFWKKFNEACGVFQIGEVFNGNVEYVASYQGPLTATFNYPLYYSINDAFKGDMKKMNEYITEKRDVYPDPTVLGVFIGNHDNERFLYPPNGRTKKQLDNASVFSCFWEGIPVVYYGDEQYFNGGGDPYCREALWENGFNKNSTLYQYYRVSLHYRKKLELWDKDLEQLYFDTDYYYFRRGNNVLVGVSPERTSTSEFDNNGRLLAGKYCNIFHKNDCIEIGDEISVELANDPKVYIPEDQIDEFSPE